VKQSQLRSARTRRLLRLPLLPPPEADIVLLSVELAPMEVPAPEDVPVEPMFVPPLLLLVPAVAPPLGVPVVPIGVCCELCWPAPVGAFLTAGLGGLPWAIAVPIKAREAAPASRPRVIFDAVMCELLWLM
jgi:hypothetical protein